MSNKIKNISISGIRGAQNILDLPLNEKSILLYGDNGTGKSSISDAIEWFLTDKVSHLSGNSEIDLKEALRNSNLTDDIVSQVALTFTNSKLNCDKTLSLKKDKLVAETLNVSDDFKNYITESGKENLLLRYQFLTDFIDNTKGEKLKYLSDIIGFSEVTKKKEVLLKSYNAIKSEIRTQNFETQINTQKHILIEKIGATISQEKNLLEKLNETIEPLKTGLTINTFGDIDTVLDFIKKPSNNKLLEELRFLENTNTALTNLKQEINLFDSEYEKYFVEFEKIASDVNAILQTFLSDLLIAGNEVISKKLHKDNSCPLCLQPKSILDLQTEIKERLAKVEESLKMKISFDDAKKSVHDISSVRVNKMETFLANPELTKEENLVIKTAVTLIKDKIFKYQTASLVKVTSGEKIPAADSLKVLDVDFKIQVDIDKRIADIKEIIKNDNSTVIYSNVSASKDAFLNIQKFEKKREKLEAQRKTLEIIYNEFVKKQKEGLENFIATFSGTINEFYQYMNPGEPFQEIKIITIGEDDNLNGITIQYKYNGKWVSPPQKYFSESHLNCFGISFFLASVKAFNFINKFLILDDVISSFDQNHRKRFAELIFEKFSDYQIILLTHEKEWFTNIVTPLAKKNGWIINKIKWTEAKGTHLNEKPSDLKEQIELQLANSEIENLGNPMRRYLEHCLKDIATSIEAKLSFKYNDSNEHRMPYELIMGIKSEIKKCSKDLALKFPIIDRIENSAALGNVLSHDNEMNVGIGDLKAIWADILELEKVFNCQQPGCSKPKVTLSSYDPISKEIKCGCSHLKYDWKK